MACHSVKVKVILLFLVDYSTSRNGLTQTPETAGRLQAELPDSKIGRGSFHSDTKSN